jgi:hypothetical protein
MPATVLGGPRCSCGFCEFRVGYRTSESGATNLKPESAAQAGLAGPGPPPPAPA